MLMADEGFRADLYQDSLGHPTIGYGTLCRGWSKTLAAKVMEYMAEEKQAALSSAWPAFHRLDAVRQDALVNMAYQLGVGGVLRFKKTLAYLERGQYAEAAAEALDSTWARQTPARAARVAAMLRTGRYGGSGDA